MPCLGQTLLKKFVSLGNECVEFLKVARSSHGKFFAILRLFICLPLCFYDSYIECLLGIY
jgi:hypothetical protein